MGLLADFQFRTKSQYAPQITYPFAQYAPVYSPTSAYALDYAYMPTVQIQSPSASGPVYSSKKQQTQQPYITSQPTIASQPQATDTETQDLTGTILILGVLAVGGYLVASWIKKK